MTVSNSDGPNVNDSNKAALSIDLFRVFVMVGFWLITLVSHSVSKSRVWRLNQQSSNTIGLRMLQSRQYNGRHIRIHKRTNCWCVSSASPMRCTITRSFYNLGVLEELVRKPLTSCSDLVSVVQEEWLRISLATKLNELMLHCLRKEPCPY